ncbi:Proteins containing BTB/POZ and Kelch domains, involved in regulatory/signal transduction processes [Plasmopara halstedii]|uniref:Proteins containing BTB/POZ and Kelch domains, involved in regulatory/signal transduction processes n=1 Tax=Plasmopara halstedii TaxID=4781 RepID=A0A0P1AGM4_PLAHL|nr:Proteins containing BTB/POZ and Kelch domains, involved in regulatory/signal transduction processes [Plasmopara halstedii]CEG39629.1 Proteins containing BTB/POZ and Kelch domains, involved in regulatory/signal transduction processes [Plasmopara halstedii]|eukprot:XP_024575998.1 Proteins containing BTB/POZ and Kelch domains, involved in regulatory/signal transduction processes [Plasmopara halstedii]
MVGRVTSPCTVGDAPIHHMSALHRPDVHNNIQEISRQAQLGRQMAESSEEEDSDDEEETQIPVDDQVTQELPATERGLSPPPIQRRSSPSSPPLPMAEALTSSPTGPAAATLSPSADVESTTPLSNDDEDSRSETSSEMSLRSNRPVRRRGSKKRVSMACSDHQNLSVRMKKAVIGEGDESFGESMIGADVVLCVKSTDNYREGNGSMIDAKNGSKAGEVRRFFAHRFILAASSPPFRAMLTGNMRESSLRDVVLHDIEPNTVEKMLHFMYTGDVVLNLESVLGLLIAAEMYELVALREMCKDFVLRYAHEVFCDPQIVQLPEKILLELIPQDELQIRELALMEALVMWGESRVAYAEKSLGDLLAEMMELVRFPTMSVSDLYGKVRPLVNDGVIREHLLTEALFNHLKWGSQTGIAAKRAKPRALTASLRKRKRVSFTQHVTFETTLQRPVA